MTDADLALAAIRNNPHLTPADRDLVAEAVGLHSYWGIDIDAHAQHVPTLRVGLLDMEASA